MEEWRFINRTEDISVHKRPSQHGKVPEWAPQYFEVQNVKKINEKETIIYVACNRVLPIAGRDYIARRTVISDLKKTMYVLTLILLSIPMYRLIMIIRYISTITMLLDTEEY